MDKRSRSQRWADATTEFSGSWTFIALFGLVCMFWIAWNAAAPHGFDPYPFLFLNWVLTIVSTFQNPLIMLSQNRQNEVDRDRQHEILQRLVEMQADIEELKHGQGPRIKGE